MPKSLLYGLLSLTLVFALGALGWSRSLAPVVATPLPTLSSPEPKLEKEIQQLLDKAQCRQDDSKFDQARFFCQEALDRARESGARRAEALARNCQGRVQTRQNRYDLARFYYQQALDIAREIDAPALEARIQYNLGTAFASLGEFELASDFFERSLYGRSTAYDLGLSLMELATRFDEADDPKLAISFLRQAFGLIPSALHLPSSSRNRTRAVILDRLAVALVDIQEFEIARKTLQYAIQITQSLKARELEGDTPCGEAGGPGDLPIGESRLRGDLSVYKSNLALVEVNQCKAKRRIDPSSPCPELADATRLFEEALELIKEGPGHWSGIYHFRLAAVLRLAGRPEAALQEIHPAVSAAEWLRTGTRNALLRTSVLAAHDKIYDELILIAMARYRFQKDPAMVLEALQAAELLKARDLQDRRQRTRRIRRDQEIQAKSRELSALETDRLLLVEDSSASLQELEDIERRQLRLVVEIEEFEHSEDQKQQPKPLELPWSDPSPFDGSNLPENTQVLYFALTDERSFLWRLASDGARVFELPPRHDLERKARVLNRFSSAKLLSTGTYDTYVRSLSKDLLGDVAPYLEGHRLFLVLDGALATLPFSRLENPATGKMLLEEFEIIHLPSLSLSRTFSPSVGSDRVVSHDRKELIVLGDPHYRPIASSSQSSSAGESSQIFPRLFGSRDEAEHIFELYSPSEKTLLLGSDVNRRAVLEGALEGYRVVHLAAHAEAHTMRPELTRIVLSQLDEDGNSIDHNLFLHEIDDLILHSDLIVLSACSTAEGKAIRGEGTISLARAVLAAGARQAIVSLWSVSDGSTAALMMRLHEAMVINGLEPAAALRSAQLAIHQTEGWEDPYHWAGFIVMGD